MIILKHSKPLYKYINKNNKLLIINNRSYTSLFPFFKNNIKNTSILINKQYNHNNNNNDNINYNNNNNNNNNIKLNNKIKKKSNLSNILNLSKFRLSLFVAGTSTAGFLAAGISPTLHFLPLFNVTLGTFLLSSSANTWNQIIETKPDSLMSRTKNRPLPSGDVNINQAKLWGIISGLSGTGLLYYGTNLTTTLLGLSNLGLYSIIYTLMKRQSELNTWVGALVGAIPPIMGWCAAGGNITDPEAIILGSLLFLWQFPHFFALSWFNRNDYSKGGFRMIPINDKEGKLTSNLILRYSWGMTILPIYTSLLGATSWMFAVEGTIINTILLMYVYKFKNKRSNYNARKVFFTSLWYLPLILGLFVFHSRYWNKEEIEGKWIYKLNNIGKDYCIHEYLFGKKDINKNTKSKACPIKIGEEKFQNAKECPLHFNKRNKINDKNNKE